MSKLESQDTATPGSGGSGHQPMDTERLQGSGEERMSPLEALKNIAETFYFWIRRLNIVTISTLSQLNLHDK